MRGRRRADRGQARRARGGRPARPRPSTPRRWPPPSPACAELRRREGRVRRRAEVPAVDGAGVPAAPPRAHRLGHRAGDGRADLRADGPRRDLRPARRRVRPLQRRRALDRAALREDALRQRAAAARLRAPGPGHRLGARPARGRRDRRVPAARPAHPRGRVRLGAGRRHRRRRGPDLRLDARPAARRARRRRRRLGRASCSGSPRRAPSSTAPRRCSCRRPRRPRALGTRAGRAARRARRASAARARRQGRHGLERAGDRRARRGRRRARPAGLGRRRRARPRTCCSSCTSSTAGCGAPRATAWSARRRACWRTTPLWPTACSRCTRPPARPGGSRPRRSCSTRPSRTSPNGRRRLFDTADDAEALLHRPREITDNATPCGGSALAGGAAHGVGAGRPTAARYREAAEAALHGAGTLLREHPRFAGHWLTVAEAQVAGPLQVAIAGDRAGCSLDRARRAAPGGTVIVAGAPDAPGVPLLADRPLVDGAARGLRLPRLRLRPPRHHARRAGRRVSPAVNVHDVQYLCNLVIEGSNAGRTR